MIRFKLTLFFYIVFLLISNHAFSFELSNWYELTNGSHRKMDISYNDCIHKRDGGELTDKCQPFLITLNPGETKRFEVNSNDNFIESETKYFYHTKYVYKVVTEKSSGHFLLNTDEFNKWKKEQSTKDTKGFVQYCNLSYDTSAILDDFDTDEIRCIVKSYSFSK